MGEPKIDLGKFSAQNIEDAKAGLGDLIGNISERLNLRTIGRELLDGAVSMVSQGASEMASAIYSGNAYSPQIGSGLSVTETVHAEMTTPQQLEETAAQPASPTVEAPAAEPASGWGQQAPMGYPEIGYSSNATIIDMQPQIESTFEDRLNAAAAIPQRSDDSRGMER